MPDLSEGFSGLSEEEKAATAAALGGQEAMSGLLAIVGASPEEYEKLQSAIANCDGTAERMAETMLDNLQGSLTILKSSLEGLGIEVYESMPVSYTHLDVYKRQGLQRDDTRYQPSGRQQKAVQDREIPNGDHVQKEWQHYLFLRIRWSGRYKGYH